MRVSVICPVHNTRPDELNEAIGSVLSQPEDLIQEIILIDDASSSPDTVSAIRALAASIPFLKTISARKSTGPGQARNEGLALASGDWIGFLDSDDIWPPGKLEAAQEIVKEHPEAEWIIGDFTHFRLDRTDSVAPGASCFSLSDPAGARSATPQLTRSIILDGLHLGTCLVRTDTIGALRFDQRARFGEDLLFLARLSLGNEAYHAPGLSYLCRRQHESLMYSSARITAKYASGARLGFNDPDLHEFRKEYRWVLYDLYKELAVNNLLNGQKWGATKFAFSAYILDPRELRDLIRFFQLLTQAKESVAKAAKTYSRREQFVLPPSNY